MAAIRPLIEAVSSDSPLVVFGAAGDVCAWSTPVERALDAAAMPRPLIDGLRRREMRVAIGTPARGLAGFVATRRQADAARAVAVLRPETIVTRYAEVALLALLLRDHAAARTFAAEPGSTEQLPVIRGGVRTRAPASSPVTACLRGDTPVMR